MIKIKLYYSIVAILFLFPVSVTKEMTFYLFPPNRSMAFIMMKKLSPMSWLHSLLLIVEFLWFNVVNFLVNLFVRF